MPSSERSLLSTCSPSFSMSDTLPTPRRTALLLPRLPEGSRGAAEGARGYPRSNPTTTSLQDPHHPVCARLVALPPPPRAARVGAGPAQRFQLRLPKRSTRSPRWRESASANAAGRGRSRSACCRRCLHCRH